MLRWDIRRQGAKSSIAWGSAKTKAAAERAIKRTLRVDLHMLNPDRLEIEIKEVT